jgi:hypothetical protein
MHLQNSTDIIIKEQIQGQMSFIIWIIIPMWNWKFENTLSRK